MGEAVQHTPAGSQPGGSGPISRNANDRFDEDFYRRRVRHAWEYRKTVMAGDFNCFRLVFGEADRFGGGDVLFCLRFLKIIFAFVGDRVLCP